MAPLRSYFLAVRPWSLPASISTLLIGTALSYNSFDRIALLPLILCYLGEITVQCTANVMNSYYDHLNGLDKKEDSADRTLFDLGISPSQLKFLLDVLSYVSLFFGLLLVLTMPDVYGSLGILVRFLFGFSLGYCYTSGPFKLKYNALGDVTNVTAFGPLILDSFLFVQARHNNPVASYSFFWSVLFSLPAAIIVVGILHANNTRDMKTDSRAGIKTIAGIIGEENCFYYECALFAASFLGVIVLSFRSSGLWSWFGLLPLIMVPHALNLLEDFRQKKFADLCERIGQYSAMFSILFSLGIIISGLSV